MRYVHIHGILNQSEFSAKQRGNIMKSKRLMAMLMAAAAAAALSGCGTLISPDEAEESVQVFAMDTVMICSTYGENSSDAAFASEDEIYRLEALLSRTREDSAVSRINSGDAGAADEEVRALIEKAMEYSQATGGAFDITLAPVSSAWGFTEDAYRVPSQAELDELLTHVGMEHVHLTADGVELDAGTQIDLGAIAKGYASDVVADLYEKWDIPRGLARLGGNIYAKGTRPDGGLWRVGVQDPANPEDSNALVGVLELSDAFAVTSGGYQRYFEDNGKTYHHIIDPATGYPAESGLTSVTVVSDRASGGGTMCDAFSTALFVMGEEKALDFWRTGGYDFDLVLVTQDGRVLVTEGIADAFTLDEGSGYTCETVS